MITFQSTYPEVPQEEFRTELSIDGINRLQEKETLKRLNECLGSSSELIVFDSNFYSMLWHNLSTDYNTLENINERLISPVGILEEYCRLRENHPDLECLASPAEFSDNLISISLRLKLDMLATFYLICQETLRKVSVESEGKNLNKEKVYSRINQTFYEVPQEWLIP